MRIIRTDTSKPEDIPTQTERDWCYNGLDCCVTLEVHGAINPQLDNHTAATYEFSRQLQGPILEMNLRGVRRDKAAIARALHGFYEQLQELEDALERIVVEGVGMPSFNWASNADLQKLFYEYLALPPVRYRGRPTVAREAIEKLGVYTSAQPIVYFLTTMRDIFSKIKVLRMPLDEDGRSRTSYNIGGTSTGRLSSSYSEYGTGGNLQNIEMALRSTFISDPGMKFAKFDAKSGESFIVGAIEWNLFNDARYLEACETGDPHTYSARLCWPELPWTGELKADKRLAETPYYRHLSHRDVCKRVGHGSNYGGQPPTIATQARLPIEVVQEFQDLYFGAFPAHQKWQDWVRRTLREDGYLISLMGRKRWFFGRRDAPDTQREAIAYDPQGSLSDIVNTALIRIFHYRKVQLILQDHDAITIQYREADEAEVLLIVQQMLIVPVELANGRVLRIPYDCKIGWNRADKTEKNPDGLTDWTGRDERRRSPEVSFLDQRFR